MNELIEDWKQEEKTPFVGWNFSHIRSRTIEEGPTWDYVGLAKDLVSRSKSLLDIATGGGEMLSRLAPLPDTTFAIEGYEPNVAVAKNKLEPLGVKVLFVDELGKYPFTDNQFDAVINRHGGLNLEEIYRVSDNGGQFLTQQVSGNNLEDLITFFDAQMSFPDDLLSIVSEQAEKIGFQIKRAEEWNSHTEFLDVGALVYYLKAIPWVVPGFTVESHLPYLQKLQEKLESGEKLKFSIGRFLLQLEKC